MAVYTDAGHPNVGSTHDCRDRSIHLLGIGTPRISRVRNAPSCCAFVLVGRPCSGVGTVVGMSICLQEAIRALLKAPGQGFESGRNIW